MRFNKANSFFLLLIITVIYTLSFGCVSLNKFEILQKSFDSLKSSSASIQKGNIQLNRANDSLVNINSIIGDSLREKMLFINNMSSSFTSDMPVLPNPPPQSSDHIVFGNILKGCQTYAEANDRLNKAFNGDEMVYLGFNGDGFAVASAVDEIDYKGRKIKEEITKPDDVISMFKRLFSLDHLNELMFSKTGYFRIVVFIVSPDVNRLNGTEISSQILTAWVKEDYTKFPFEKLQNPMPKDTKIYELLYEFEQNENLRGKTILLTEKHITNLRFLPITKTLMVQDERAN